MVSSAEDGNKIQEKTAETNAAKESQEFASDLAKITEAVNAPEQADTISALLDTNFKAGLDTLYKTDAGKTTIQTLATTIANQLTVTTIDTADKKALEAVQTLITPLIMEAGTAKFDNKNTGEIITTGKKNEAYNTTEQKGKILITNAITKINTADTYKDLPGKQQIVQALNNPMKENIVSLQNFLFKSLPKDQADLLALGSRQGDEKTGKWDGKYGEKTNRALDAYLTQYTTFTDTEKGKASLKTTAEKVANDLSTATDKANIPPVVTTEGTRVEATVSVKKTEQQIQEENIQNLTTLQNTDAFKNLPGKIRREINRILKLQDKDEKTDNNIDRVTKEVEDITKNINKFTSENSVKQERIGNIVSERDQMKGISALKTKVKELDREEKQLNRTITANNDQLTLLSSDLIDKRDYLITLNHSSTKKTDKMEDKLTAVTTLLEEEKIQKTADLNAIQGLHITTDLTTEITSLQKDIANLTDVQTKIAALQTEKNGPTADNEAEAKIKAEIEAKIKAEIEAKIKAETEAKTKAETEAKTKAETEAKIKAETEAKTKAETEAKTKAETNVTPNIPKTANQLNEAEIAEKFKTIETKFKNLGYLFELDKDGTGSIKWPDKKNMTTIQDEDFIGRSMDQMMSQRKLETKIRILLAGGGNANISATIENKQWQNPNKEYITRAKSITIRNIKFN